MKRLIPLLLLAVSMAGAAEPAAPMVESMMKSAELDDGRTITTLLLRGVDPNARNARGMTALHVSVREDSGKALDSLLADPRTDVNAANADGETALMLAAIKGRLDWVQLLVKKGAQINREGWTPLHYACSGPDHGVVAWLIGQGAELDARSPNGTTPLMMAARYGAMDTADVLLKAGADARLRNEQNLAAADFAKAAGRDALVKRLPVN